VLTTEDGYRLPAFRSRTIASVLVGLTLAAAATSVHSAGPTAATGPSADAAAGTDASKRKEYELEEVIVTGSLIPQVRTETSVPIATITAEDMQIKGFATVADALQHSSFSTGAVQGPQFSVGFTPGAETISLFGLSPSYTKYLIDGRPIADYPALYNGTDVITSISGIPTVLVEGIDILPGGQSSLYGSDAIAGVVNIRMRKKIDGIEVDARYGWDKDGGGSTRRLGLAGGFDVGPVNIVVGGQYENTNPIWGYQRALTSKYFADGPTPQTAERDFVIFGSDGSTYNFPIPGACAGAASLFNNSLHEYTRPGHGTYCGTTNGGYYTIGNASESTQAYVRASDDISPNLQVFAEALFNHDVQRFAAGGNFYETQSDSSAGNPFYYYYDPNLGDEVNVQRFFAPEEAGSINEFLNKNTNNSIRGTIGVEGSIGSSSWKYSADMTYTENKLTERTRVGTEAGLTAWFASIAGPELDPSLNPFGDGDKVYAPNYADFYKPVTPAQYAAFSTELASYSRTEESLARAGVTNSDLFTLPGGAAGLAVVVEGGNQGWEYVPDPGFLDGTAYLYTASAGSGHRSRMAETAELRLPVHKMLTFDLSGRNDDYKVAGDHVKKATYNVGVEFRPIQSLLFRGRYGTSFKVPTLSDEFQQLSGFFQTVTDYYKCAQLGFTGNTIGNCPYASAVNVFGTTEGNPKLQPINAKNYDIGIVWSPIARSAFSVDYIHWDISNEVQEQSIDQLLRTESACRLGQLDSNSPTCVQTLAQVQRDPQGNLAQVNTPKINVSQETLAVIVVGLNYTWTTSAAGDFVFDGSYNNTLKHDFVQYTGDPTINYLQSPFYSTEFKTKENLSVTWNFHEFGTTLYVEHYGQTPNNLAQQVPEGYAQPGAGRIGTWTIANLSARYEVIPGLTVSANVNNLFDKMPPTDNSFPGTTLQAYNYLNYNVYGRAYFVEADYKFGKKGK
jgi:iron complex outermembrane recepter protein